MNFCFKFKLILGLLCLFHYGGTASLNEADSEEEFAAPIYPQPRIVRGSKANERQFPYQISLRFDGRHICGGSIISSNYIVTAAHCVTTGSVVVTTPPSRLSVQVGTNQRNNGGHVVGVSKVTVHLEYYGFLNDIALLQLSSPLEFNDRVQAIPLASQEPPTGAPVLTSGWGRLSKNGPMPNELQYITLAALTNADCTSLYRNVPETVICLEHTYDNGGACKYDSGGPAVYNNQLVGVTNYGNCGTSNLPDGYASVAYFYEWLKDHSDV